MCEIDDGPPAVGPLVHVGGCVAVFHGASNGFGEEGVPVLVAGWQPVRTGVHYDLFFGEVRLGPLVAFGVLFADLWLEQHGPESGAAVCDDGCGSGVDAEPAIPTAHEVGGFAKLAVGSGRVINSVGEA